MQLDLQGGGRVEYNCNFKIGEFYTEDVLGHR